MGQLADRQRTDAGPEGEDIAFDNCVVARALVEPESAAAVVAEEIGDETDDVDVPEPATVRCKDAPPGADLPRTFRRVARKVNADSRPVPKRDSRHRNPG